MNKSLLRRKNRRSFTLLELLTVIAVIAILASLLLPALKSARDSSKKIVCMSNLKQIGAISSFYSGDFNGYYPNIFWNTQLKEYLNNNNHNEIGKCPSAPNKNILGAKLYLTYATTGVYFNDLSIGFGSGFDHNYFVRAVQVCLPSGKCAFLDYWQETQSTDRDWNSSLGALNDQKSRALHNDSPNYLFSDGHGETIHLSGGYFSETEMAIPVYYWTPSSGSDFYKMWRPKLNESW
ncbi:MAG: hypothetical protein A2020_05195 [Lentisphaerae bacterium GWF2_45_14]|nr:MAG: hypothetical protein A2020_05195 [Lentisphaerae bacterium GWF2_45_14]